MKMTENMKNIIRTDKSMQREFIIMYMYDVYHDRGCFCDRINDGDTIITTATQSLANDIGMTAAALTDRLSIFNLHDFLYRI